MWAIGASYPSHAAKHRPEMMLPSRSMVGVAAEYNSACVNTLRRSCDGNYTPARQRNLVGRSLLELKGRAAMRAPKLIFIMTLALATQAHAQTDFFEIRDTLSTYKAEKKGKTSAQKAEADRRKKDYIKSLIGQTVEWRGWIDDVKSNERWTGGMEYKIQIDMEPPSKFFSTSDVSLKTENSAVANLAIDTPVIINGIIKDINSVGKITLEPNVLKQGHDQTITQDELHAAQQQRETAQQKREAGRAAFKEKQNQIEQQGSEAYIACQNTIKSGLTSPHTAKFPWMDWQYRVLPDNETATVRSHVDSQNQFGAEIRTIFECHMKYLGDGRWETQKAKTFNAGD